MRYERLHWYLDRGKYVLQLKRFRKYFSKDQMFILITEELKRDPFGSLKQIFNFLEVDPTKYDFTKISQKHNIGYSPKALKLHMTLNRVFGSKVGSKERFLGDWYRRSLFLLRKNKRLWELFFTPGYPKLSLETRNVLLKYFEPYNKKLEAFLGRKIEVWSEVKKTSPRS